MSVLRAVLCFIPQIPLIPLLDLDVSLVACVIDLSSVKHLLSGIRIGPTETQVLLCRDDYLNCRTSWSWAWWWGGYKMLETQQKEESKATWYTDWKETESTLHCCLTTNISLSLLREHKVYISLYFVHQQSSDSSSICVGFICMQTAYFCYGFKMYPLNKFSLIKPLFFLFFHIVDVYNLTSGFLVNSQCISCNESQKVRLYNSTL